MQLLPDRSDQFLGKYEGVIVDVDDPKKLGRVRVRVRGLFDTFVDSEIPFAEVVRPAGDAGDNTGTYSPLKTGQYVMIEFRGGDSRFPLVVGQVPYAPDGFLQAPDDATGGVFSLAFMQKSAEGEPEPEPGIDYNQDRVETFNGLTVYQRANHSYRIVQRQTGTAIEITREGHIVLHSEKGLYLSSQNPSLFQHQSVVDQVAESRVVKSGYVADSAGAREIDTVGNIVEDVGGSRKLNAGSISTTSIGSSGEVVGGKKSVIVKDASEETIVNANAARFGKKTIVAVGDALLGTVAGNIKMATAVEPTTGTSFVSSMEIGLDGTIEIKSIIGAISIKPDGQITFENASASFDIDAAGGIECKNNIGKIKLTQSGQTEIDGTGLKFSGNGQQLAKIMDQLLQAIITQTHPTNVGMSGVPANVSEFLQIQSQLKTLLF